ncbi:MAG: PAS domain-containing protein [Scytonematopsis contorta HA4267-MV1]|jgi:PAS domain-containing protein|nr:PAS domain-containing protein [Scytonematopsis contorta HA4267-MV1]
MNLHCDLTVQCPFLYVSPGSYEIYELTPGQIQTDINLIFSCNHPEEAESFYNSIALSAQTLKPWQWEGRTILPSKQLKWIKGASRPEKQADGTIVWYGVVLDVTSRKQAEAALKKSESQYRNLVETIKDVIWSTDE